MVTLLILLPLLAIHSFAYYDKYREIVRSLDEWERALLRDFVRGKGRGSVSRIPVELLNEPPPELDAMHDDNFVSFMAPPESALRAGPMMNVPHESLRSISITAKQTKKLRNSKEDRPVPPVIMPASKVRRRPVTMTNSTIQKRNRTEWDEPTQETFRELSGLLQTFIDRRKPLLQRVAIPSASTTPSSRSTNHDDKTGDTSSGTVSAVGQWEAMNPEDESDDQEEMLQTSSSGQPHEDWEAKMRELSGQLSTILMQIKKAKESRPVKYAPLPEKPKPKVTILRNDSLDKGYTAGEAVSRYPAFSIWEDE